MIFKHWNVSEIVTGCVDQTGVERSEIKAFEASDDLEHLPNSKALKEFFRCVGEAGETIDKKSNKLLLAKAGNFFAELTREDQEIYVRMGKGCMKYLRQFTDRYEFAYELQVCLKRNDNEVNSSEEKDVSETVSEIIFFYFSTFQHYYNFY